MTRKYKFVKTGEDQFRAEDVLSGEDIIHYAAHLSSARMKRGSTALSSPLNVRSYLQLHIGQEVDEKFWVLFLDNRHRVISHEVLFHGSIDSAAVYPRVVVRRSLEVNAAALIFAHNHPSGVAEPSDTDTRLTRKLTDALLTVDIRVLDHLIVGGDDSTSMAERGLL